MKQNCWEFKSCGRQPGGVKSSEMGICPASTERVLDGIHGGKNAGRACWVVAGTFCGGALQGTEAQKKHNCWQCTFFQRVKQEEKTADSGFSTTMLGMINTLKNMKRAS